VFLPFKILTDSVLGLGQNNPNTESPKSCCVARFLKANVPNVLV
jgi:hypothetical protein